MFKKIVFICLVAQVLSAQEIKTEKFQIVANKVNTKNDIITAKGDVVIFSPSYYASAKKIIYNKKEEYFELFDDVLIIKDNTIQTQSDYAYLDTKNETLNQKPSLIYQNENNLWINSNSSNKDKDIVTLEDSIISSCDCEDPAWSIKVSSANYNTKTKWLHTFNTRLYIKNVPIFYTPYFGFPTDKTRRTGLLIPTLGYGKNEGFYYAQPIYFAPAKNYDIELIPQIRTNRGEGIYGYFRYIDSQYSKLSLKSGVFKEDGDYAKKNDLKNDKHFGYNLTYERTKLFSKNDAQDGLYADINWLNDVEYKNLEDDKYDSSTEKQIESKINYFYNKPSYYLGTYFRYYLDTQAASNDATLQELPQVQYHKYSKNAFDRALYSIDTRVTNYAREDGINAQKYEFTLPVSYSFSLLDDYLHFVVENQTILNHFEYTKSNNNLKDGTFIENSTKIGFTSDLVKPYDNFIHTMNLGVDYTNAHTLRDSGDLYKLTNNNSELSYFPVNETKDSINLRINQSFYDDKSLKQIVNHKMRQSIVYENSEAQFQNLENEITYNYLLGTISNKLVYNHEDKKIIENSTSFSFNYNDFILKLGYYQSKQTEHSGKENLESYTIDTDYKISRDYKIGYSEKYNLEESTRSKQTFKFTILDRCWELDLKYEKELVASSTSNPRKQDILYMQILLKPLGGLKQQYKVKESK